MRIKWVIIFVTVSCFINLINCRPADEPTKFSLDTSEGSVKNSAVEPLSRWDQGRALLSRIMDMIRIARGRIVNSVTLARNILADRAEMIASESQNHVVRATATKSNVGNQGRRSVESGQNVQQIDFRPQSGDKVRLENESEQGILERPKPQVAGSILENFFKPTPIVDGIREEEKYGNSGDKFIGIGRALVGGFEGFSNFLNTVIDFPVNAAKKTSRGITEALNQIGARLIGLQ